MRMYFRPEDDGDLANFRKMLVVTGLGFFEEVPRKVKILELLAIGYYVLSYYGLQYVCLKTSFKEAYIDNPYGSMILAFTYTHVQLLIYLKNTRRLNRFVDHMKAIRRRRVLGWEKEIMAEASSRSWRLVNNWVLLISLYFLFFVLCPLGYDMILVAAGSSADPCLPNIFYGYLADPKARNWRLYLTTFLSLVLITVACAQTTPIVCLMPTVTGYISAELRIITRELQLWSRDLDNPNRGFIFKEIVQKHAKILEEIYAMREYLGELYLPQAIVIPVGMTFYLYVGAQSISTGVVGKSFDSFYSLAGLVVNVFIISYYGQALYDETEQFSEALYMIPWYQETPKTRKDLLMMMSATQKPVVISFKGTVPINLRLFSETMNASYSCFTILQSFF